MYHSRGFTTLEVLLVIALLAALFTFGLSTSSTLQNVIGMRGARQVESLLLMTSERARNGVGGTSWGLYFSYDEVSRKATQATIFSGNSYATRDVTKDLLFPLDGILQLTTISLSGSGVSSGNDHESVFSTLSGTTAQYGSLTVTTYSRTTTITISPDGIISRVSL